MVYWLSVRTLNTGVKSSIPALLTIKTPLTSQSTGNTLIKSISLEETQSPVPVSATRQLDYATQLNDNIDKN